MIPDWVYREMVGDELADAVFAARTRLSDPTVIARCFEQLWSVERGEDPAAIVSEGLSMAEAISTLEALE